MRSGGRFQGGGMHGGGGKHFSVAEFDDAQSKRRYDGKNIRKAVARRAIDYRHSYLHLLENFSSVMTHGMPEQLLPLPSWRRKLPTPLESTCSSASIVCDKFVHKSESKSSRPGQGPMQANTLAWTPEGRWLVAGHTDGQFTLWHGMEFNFVLVVLAHTGKQCWISCIQWTHDGRFLFSSDHEGKVKIFNPALHPVKSFQPHTKPINALSVAPTGLKLATCSADTTLKIIDVRTQNTEHSFGFHRLTVNDCHWHPFGSLVASCGAEGQVAVFDARTRAESLRFPKLPCPVEKLRWNCDGLHIVTGAQDQRVRLYDIRNSSKPLYEIRNDTASVYPTAFSWHPTFRRGLAVGDSEGSISFWDTRSLFPAKERTGFSHSPLGRVKMGHRSGGASSGAGRREHQAITWLSYHPNGHVLVSASRNRRIHFWCRHRPGDSLRDIFHMDEFNDDLPAGDYIDPTAPELQYNTNHFHSGDQRRSTAARLIQDGGNADLKVALPGMRRAAAEDGDLDHKLGVTALDRQALLEQRQKERQKERRERLKSRRAERRVLPGLPDIVARKGPDSLDPPGSVDPDETKQ
eukprot:gnl/Dysnectes_brevis/3162_a3944_559.p1 GENE.gnl/Dysnectes_brevis/3162_a3944_559~~gnl/Dysnectes_brevis/3162_a3944_559.p1  ORF type:complete len:576 (-),score=194.17 gnl/Dysnectes_brevis/3162_a3944_559:33-1760(-)